MDSGSDMLLRNHRMKLSWGLAIPASHSSVVRINPEKVPFNNWSNGTHLSALRSRDRAWLIIFKVNVPSCLFRIHGTYKNMSVYKDAEIGVGVRSE